MDAFNDTVVAINPSVHDAGFIMDSIINDETLVHLIKEGAVKASTPLKEKLLKTVGDTDDLPKTDGIAFKAKSTNAKKPLLKESLPKTTEKKITVHSLAKFGKRPENKKR